MAKTLKNILNGVKASKIVPGSTGKDPGVDYAPKAPNDQEFVKLHKTEKHSDRVGNTDELYQATNIKHSQADEPKHGYKKPQDKSVNEAAKCNMTEEGTACPVHEMADCSKPKKTLKEVLTKKTSAGEVIDDFRKSKDSRFDGKSKEERKRMALGAYYSMHPEKSKKNQTEGFNSGAEHGIGSAEELDETAKSFETKKKILSAIKDLSHEHKAKHPNDFFIAHHSAEKIGQKAGVGADAVHRHMKQGVQGYASKKLAGGKLGYRYVGEDLAVPLVGSTEMSEDLAVPLLGGSDDDESAEMAKTQLRALANKALHLAMQLNDDQIVEPWVQSKIAVAKDYVTAVHDYMVYGDHSKDKENEQAPREGGIDFSGMTGAPTNTFPSYSVDVNTGRNV
jgi:hypothetical protein